ncbi:MAG: hypothetical protein BWK80_63235, partial [Desulfobacteraceae bacterium IS3]
MLALEPRYLYDAAGVAVGLDILSDSNTESITPDHARGSEHFSETSRSDASWQNHPPILDSSTTSALTPVSEDNTNPYGDAVESLIRDIVSDPDGDPVGIAVTHLDNSNGVWQYSLNNGSSWKNFGVVSDTSAVLLAPDAKIRFVPDSEFNGVAEITFRAWDQSAGTSGISGVDPTSWETKTVGISVGSATALFDGNTDVLSASEKEDSISWYRNIDGNGRFSSPSIISVGSEDGEKSAFIKDIDGDGDSDLLSTCSVHDKVVLYENIDGKGTFIEKQVITTDADGASSAIPADIDGDGDPDVVLASWNEDAIAWYENTDGKGNFGTEQIISVEADGASCVFAADVDGDGDIDVVSASAWDNKIAWYENTDGKGNFGSQKIISTDANWALSVFAGDIDGDGDADVVSASANDNKIAWYENTDGKGSFGTQKLISLEAEGASFVFAGDIDGDGDADVLSASANDNKIAWYENTDGKGSFAQQNTITTQADGVLSLSIADVDADGDSDVISASLNDGKVAWYENTDGAGAFVSQNVIYAATGSRVSFVFAGDVDSDGDADVLSLSENSEIITWYENDGAGNFGTPMLINPEINRGIKSVFSIDLDGDNDADVVSAFAFDDKIVWYENTDGKGTFTEKQVIASDADGAKSLFAGDLDGDGDPDILSASENDDKIVWYENTDGKGSYVEKQVITIEADGASSVFAVDIDGDGDLDVLSASSFDDKIAWYENTDGKGTFGSQRVISTAADRAVFVVSADMDGDGDADVVSLSENDDKVAWYENTDGKGTFGAQRVISDRAGAISIVVSDIDGDGDIDVSSAYAWYENDGSGDFGEANVINASADRTSPVFMADVDGDGNSDLISPSKDGGYVVWYQNNNAYSADSGTAIVTVEAVNDAPTAKDDTVTTNEDVSLVISVSSLTVNDTDAEGDAITVLTFTQPSHGSLIDNENGTLTYTPDPNFNGTDNFTYTISDGNGGADSADVRITVNSVNDKPVAKDDSISTDENTAVKITSESLLKNDTDADGDA